MSTVVSRRSPWRGLFGIVVVLAGTVGCSPPPQPSPPSDDDMLKAAYVKYRDAARIKDFDTVRTLSCPEIRAGITEDLSEQTAIWNDIVSIKSVAQPENPPRESQQGVTGWRTVSVDSTKESGANWTMVFNMAKFDGQWVVC